MLGATVLQKHNLTKLIPLDREGWSFLSARPSTLQASQCSRSRCNTDRPADSASLSSHAPTGLPGYLPSRIHNETESKARIIPGGGLRIDTKVIQQVKQVQKWYSSPGRKASRSMIDMLQHLSETYRTDGQTLQGERMSAEQQEPPSSCPTRSFALCPSSSGSPLRR